jgi:hypothetical protein
MCVTPSTAVSPPPPHTHTYTTTTTTTTTTNNNNNNNNNNTKFTSPTPRPALKSCCSYAHTTTSPSPPPRSCTEKLLLIRSYHHLPPPPQSCTEKLEAIKRDQAAIRRNQYAATTCPICFDDFERLGSVEEGAPGGGEAGSSSSKVQGPGGEVEVGGPGAYVQQLWQLVCGL